MEQAMVYQLAATVGMTVGCLRFGWWLFLHRAERLEVIHDADSDRHRHSWAPTPVGDLVRIWARMVGMDVMSAVGLMYLLYLARATGVL